MTKGSDFHSTMRSNWHSYTAGKDADLGPKRTYTFGSCDTPFTNSSCKLHSICLNVAVPEKQTYAPQERDFWRRR